MITKRLSGQGGNNVEVNVKFLGEEYTFSTDIKEYVRISNLAD